uniref:Uncharacterized protein n=1 Tax=Onchocerca volvulus TaxID=6282 RepID=A0A8R1TMD3_ONCVO
MEIIESDGSNDDDELNQHHSSINIFLFSCTNSIRSAQNSKYTDIDSNNNISNMRINRIEIGYRKKRNNNYGDETIFSTEDLAISQPTPAEKAPEQATQSYFDKVSIIPSDKAKIAI